ncbi:hypothetical protein ACWGI0_06145 [Streptomyces sp. NPDC054802]
MGDQGLEIDDSEAFHRKEQTFERVGWAALALLLVAACLGVFGDWGPVASATAKSPGGVVTMEYNRFDRYTARTDLTITAGAAAVEEGEVVLTLSSDWVDGAGIEQITPEPDSWESGPDGLQLTFTTASAPLSVQVSYRPDTIGPTSGTVTDENTGARLSFSQFVYP